jgi:hypothetical protein
VKAPAPGCALARGLLVALLVALGGAALAPSCQPHPAPRHTGPRAGAARGLGDNNRWVMAGAGAWMEQSGGAKRLLALCNRAARDGYTGLVLWDPNLWERDLPPAYAANARALKAGLERLRFALLVAMAPQGSSLRRWSGDETILEPAPRDPHPEAKPYRYLCLSHPHVLPIWEAQVRRAEGFYHPTGWLLQYDELRVAAADARCRATGKSPGQLLAAHARAAIAMCRRVSAGAVVAVWDDMFDPYHNAGRRPYYHVSAGFGGSWAGIDSEVLVLNFNDRPDSFRFWAARGNRQLVAGYFDGELGLAREGRLIRDVRHLPGLIGWMYTTWKDDYSQLSPYGAISGFGRSGPPPAPARSR